jgi:ABC-type transport system substrate-binding protein
MARRLRSSLLAAIGIAAVLTLGVSSADAQKKGGVLRVGNLGEPPALDAHWTTASITETLTNHLYEGLYSLDRENKPIPMLADGHTVSAFYDPTHHIYLTNSWPGWTNDEAILKLQAELARETDAKKRTVLWEQQTRQFYEKVPVIRYGDLFGLRAARNTVKGFNESTERIRFYNVWLDK